jgi:hypothetical protein
MAISVSTWPSGAPYVPVAIAWLLPIPCFTFFPLSIFTVHVLDRRERSLDGSRWPTWTNGMAGFECVVVALPRAAAAIALLVAVVFAFTPRDADGVPSGHPVREANSFFVDNRGVRTEVNRATYDELLATSQAQIATTASVLIFLSIATGWGYRRYAVAHLAVTRDSRSPGA